ncbi:FAD-dependent monooxygenase [Psychromarinibacter sp. C21-152]|uniref:FAD-dependent monooxygenase n=1 Tax=Psychromarinibacter sediminicola TaxID=3033385 RepID=A0AAE3NUP9_9RHOB|nr:FAD-dependent monooxygenase [Psychromarinibacter sediminicola]
MTRDYDVIVNGGGPVGMGLAIELGQRGVRVCVVERYPEPQPVPKGQNLTQRTAEHFRAWACEAELRVAHPIPEGAGIGGLTTYRTLLSDYTYDWLTRESVADYYATANARLPQYATERVLRARAAEIEAVDVLYGWEGAALAQDADGVTLEIAERTGDARRSLRGRYLVGADGSKSFIREAAGIPQTLRDHDRRMVLAVFDSPELHEKLERYPGKAFFCVLHPDYEGYWLFFGRVDHGRSFFFHAPVPLDTTTENFDFRAFIAAAIGADVALEIDYLGFWDLRIAIADRYRTGRVFIAGDACHSHPPYGGYGVNMGLEDARNLGWKLAAAIQGWGGEALLDSYDAERRPVFESLAEGFIERYIREDRAFLETHSPDADPEAFRAAWEGRNLDAAEVDAFEPNYEGSPLCPVPGARPSAKGRHALAARAGHHLSPADLSDGRAVYDAIGDGFTLLDFTADGRGAAFGEAAARLGLPFERVADARGPAAARYGAEMVLVRPDHYVAWAGDDGAAAEVLAVAAGREAALAGAG